MLRQYIDAELLSLKHPKSGVTFRRKWERSLLIASCAARDSRFSTKHKIASLYMRYHYPQPNSTWLLCNTWCRHRFTYIRPDHIRENESDSRGISRIVHWRCIPITTPMPSHDIFSVEESLLLSVLSWLQTFLLPFEPNMVHRYITWGLATVYISMYGLSLGLNV